MAQETVWQKRKKNESRLKAKDRAFYGSIQKRSYSKKKKEKELPDNQNKLF